MKVRLNQAERESATWLKVRAVAQEKLAAFRARVENPELPEAERLGLCWRIKELKELLKLEEPEPDDKPPAMNTDAGY